MQEAFLQAFAGLGRLRDPDRFGAWLAGIVRNISRAAARQAPLMLLAEWPEDLHPASAQSLPSAEDLDRAEVLRAAVAGLPVGQRRAVELYYFADLPAGRIGGSPGAAKASLHKARRRLREHITARRPDLIPVPQPYGDVFAHQMWIAGEYRGATVTLAAEISAQDVAGHAELSLFTITHTEDRSRARPVFPAPPGRQPTAVRRDRRDSGKTITGSSDWTRYQITAQVPPTPTPWGSNSPWPAPARSGSAAWN